MKYFVFVVLIQGIIYGFHRKPNFDIALRGRCGGRSIKMAKQSSGRQQGDDFSSPVGQSGRSRGKRDNFNDNFENRGAPRAKTVLKKERWRNQPAQATNEDYDDEGISGRSAGVTGSPQTSKKRGRKPGSQPRMYDPSDPWQALQMQLDSPLGRAGGAKSVGKVPRRNVPDELECPHFDVCSGCSIQGSFNDTPVVRKARAFFKSQGLDLGVRVGAHKAWRTRVRLAVAPMSKWGGLKIGLYEGAFCAFFCLQLTGDTAESLPVNGGTFSATCNSVICPADSTHMSQTQAPFCSPLFSLTSFLSSLRQPTRIT